jgi:hypothetical protein
MAALVAPGLVGCGGHRGTHAAGGGIALTRPDKPVWCPTSSGPGETGQSRPNAPDRGSFDARTNLGLGENQASTKIRASRCSVRVIARDGHNFVLTADFRANRVNLTIARGVVTSIGVY